MLRVDFYNAKFIILDVLKQNQIVCKVIYDKNFKHPMMYKAQNNEILYNSSKFKPLFMLYPELREEIVVRLLTYKEIGRFVEINTNKVSLAEISEKSILENGKKYVPKGLMKYYQNFMADELKKYV